MFPRMRGNVFFFSRVYKGLVARLSLSGEDWSARIDHLRGPEREFFIDNLLVRIHFIIVMIRWTDLAPWEFEFSFPGSLTSTFLGHSGHLVVTTWTSQAVHAPSARGSAASRVPSKTQTILIRTGWAETHLTPSRG